MPYVSLQKVQFYIYNKSEKSVLTLTKLWPLPMPLNAYSKKDNMALLTLYTMLKGKYHGDFDLAGSKLCSNTFT